MLKSREVKIGNISIGGNHPIVIQSMTNTNTNDIKASVEQCMRIFNAGASMVRLTTQGLKEVENLKKIKTELVKKGYTNPIIADVHYSPIVASAAAKIADKVRINPGNFAGFNAARKTLHTQAEYIKELGTIRELLGPLIEICKEHSTALRIGVNHGSLSERILSRYGDTPEGMAESAMEFIRILNNLDFHNVVISMKSSNVRVMVYATRLLVKKMQEEDKIYPVHLGLTEAGEGKDGRIKSSISLASLLNEGIGDTIRISLTEEPEQEIPVAKKIIEFFSTRDRNLPQFDKTTYNWSPFEFTKRISRQTENIGGHNVPIVILSLPENPDLKSLYMENGVILNEDGTIRTNPFSADYIYFQPEEYAEDKLNGVKVISEYERWKEKLLPGALHYPILDLKSYAAYKSGIPDMHFLRVSPLEPDSNLLEILDTDIFGAIILELTELDTYKRGIKFFNILEKRNCHIPVILHKKYSSDSLDDLLVKASGELGSFLLEGLGDGIWIEERKLNIESSGIREIAFGILQASDMRISKTEYISCPGCGRTLFNLQSVTEKIRSSTSHLKGLKIAIMGCIINGPGEMADADYGFVGAGPGKISLYRGKEAIKTGIPEDKALEELINLIKSDGRWIERDSDKSPGY